MPELIEAVELAQAAGASVIAITASQSPLAKKAQLCIMATISRILHLLIIDILAVGIALQRPGGESGEEQGGLDDEFTGQISHVL